MPYISLLTKTLASALNSECAVSNGMLLRYAYIALTELDSVTCQFSYGNINAPLDVREGNIHVFSVVLHDLVLQLCRLIRKQLQCAHVSLLSQIITEITDLR